MEEREAGAAARVRDFGKGHHRMAFPYYLAINNRKKKWFGFHFDFAPGSQIDLYSSQSNYGCCVSSNFWTVGDGDRVLTLGPACWILAEIGNVCMAVTDKEKPIVSETKLLLLWLAGSGLLHSQVSFPK